LTEETNKADDSLEVKFVGEKTDVASIQEEILVDLAGYLTAQSALGGTTWLPRGKTTRSPGCYRV
jgi:hypothetical protein